MTRKSGEEVHEETALKGQKVYRNLFPMRMLSQEQGGSS